MSELLPCPFCGSKSDVHVKVSVYSEFNSPIRHSFEGECLHCGATSRKCPTKEEAIEAWNTRVERTCHFDQTDEIPTISGMIRVWECSDCGRECEELNGVYEYCPHCKAKVVE